MKLIRSEPVAIMGAIEMILALVTTFGLRLTADQTGAILAAAAAVLTVITRTQVIPTVELAPVPVKPPSEDVIPPSDPT